MLDVPSARTVTKTNDKIVEFIEILSTDIDKILAAPEDLPANAASFLITAAALKHEHGSEFFECFEALIALLFLENPYDKDLMQLNDLIDKYVR